MPPTASIPISQALPATREDKKVLTATLVGTAIEWYDYFIYAQAAGLVLGPLFFHRSHRTTRVCRCCWLFATIGVAFLFRPLGHISNT